MDKDLIDKVIILTGSEGLIGKEYKKTLKNEGAIVIPVDIKLGIDITKEEHIKKIVKDTIKKYNKIDILINNVKSTDTFNIAFEECSLKEWNSFININLTGVFICCKIIGIQMLKQGYGNIINIGSTYGIVGTDQRIYGDSGINSPVHYAAAKGAIINMTRYLAAYYAGKGIRVNCLSPGGVLTNQDKEFITNYEYKTMLGRMAKKDDYNGAIIFLCSDVSKYMTGANLIIDGGWTAW